MADLWMRIIDEMQERVSGPMKFRLIMQPLVASIYAVIDGLKDAKRGKPPYFWSLLTDRANRIDMMKDGWKSVGKIFVLAFILDTVFQLIMIRSIRPVESLVVAFILAIIPYLILRGPVTRIARRMPSSSGHALPKR